MRSMTVAATTLNRSSTRTWNGKANMVVEKLIYPINPLKARRIPAQ